MTTTLQSRLRAGRKAEDRIEAYLKWHGIEYSLIGQEQWMPRWLHAKIRFEYENPELRLVKHIPEFATAGTLIQAKCADKSDAYPTVTIEKDSFEASLYYSSLEIPVLLTWWCYNEQRWGLFSNYVDKLNPLNPSVSRHEANGSHTPFYLIKKSELQPIDNFRGDLTNGR